MYNITTHPSRPSFKTRPIGSKKVLTISCFFGSHSNGHVHIRRKIVWNLSKDFHINRVTTPGIVSLWLIVVLWKCKNVWKKDPTRKLIKQLIWKDKEGHSKCIVYNVYLKRILLRKSMANLISPICWPTHTS
jgi:hypothetical protein